jgi:hypothetical protein
MHTNKMLLKRKLYAYGTVVNYIQNMRDVDILDQITDKLCCLPWHS